MSAAPESLRFDFVAGDLKARTDRNLTGDVKRAATIVPSGILSQDSIVQPLEMSLRMSLGMDVSQMQYVSPSE